GDHGFAYAEQIEAGITIGPRLVGGVGMIDRVVGRIESKLDAAAYVLRLKRLGATFIKDHTGWNRVQRRWIYDAAREAALSVVAHIAGSASEINLTTFYDGATTSEHEISNGYDLFEDVGNLLESAQTSLNFTPVFMAAGYNVKYWHNFVKDER